MRIAIFTNNFLPNPYGVSTSVDGFRKKLIKLGHEVFVFAPQWEGKEVVEEYVYRYPSISLPTKVPFALAVPFAPQIDRQIAEMDFDIIHAQHPNLLGVQAQRWAAKKKVPLVFTWHSLYDRYVHYASFVPESLASQWVMSNALGFANNVDHLIFPTQSVHDIVRTHGLIHDRVSIIPSGVDEELFARPDAEKIRDRHNIPPRSPLLVSISRLTEEKNVSFVLRAIIRVLEENEDAYFIFGGTGDLQQELEARAGKSDASDRIIFAGQIKREEVKDYLTAGDLFVYASTSETQGTIITEAMYAGAAIVGVRASGVEDVLEDGETGILVDEVSGDFVFAVQKLLRSPEVMQKLGAAAKKAAEEKYTTTACTEQLLEAYNHAILYYNDHKKK